MKLDPIGGKDFFTKLSENFSVISHEGYIF